METTRDVVLKFCCCSVTAVPDHVEGKNLGVDLKAEGSDSEGKSDFTETVQEDVCKNKEMYVG